MKIFYEKRQRIAEQTAYAAEIKTQIELESERLLTIVKSDRDEMEEFYSGLSEAADSADTGAEVFARIESMKRANSNIFRAYIQAVDTSDELSARWRDTKKSRRRSIIPAPPANSEIDATEMRIDHFARGINMYKLLLVCFIGSFFGVLIEMLWCLLRNGYIESRSGLVYGPFNLLYGVGAVALTAALYSFRNHGKWLSFLGGMLTGSAVEYLCSWAQEAVFGSRSWDYSYMPFNLNGRICLLYSVFWGLLSVLWVKNLYPRISELILKLPNRPGRILTWILTAFLIINAIVTCVAVLRWSHRSAGIEAATPFWKFIDERFPDWRMTRIFPNMSFGNN